jgi:hypothetical protein
VLCLTFNVCCFHPNYGHNKACMYAYMGMYLCSFKSTRSNMQCDGIYNRVHVILLCCVLADWAGEGLRTVIVSTDVPREFLSRASSNTRRNVETCGILAGSLVIDSQLLGYVVIA